MQIIINILYCKLAYPSDLCTDICQNSMIGQLCVDWVVGCQCIKVCSS